MLESVDGVLCSPSKCILPLALYKQTKYTLFYRNSIDIFDSIVDWLYFNFPDTRRNTLFDEQTLIAYIELAIVQSDPHYATSLPEQEILAI
ncbi:hypothetical protein TNIN_402541 [Trichonephila inaurata madagascariensis]|uniref:Uncharacterized protein n=1 Tax=Trichonephila inaurata madagascariensis TaxID=2747483 RepID=A0A8X7BWN3_9ARAC|nr:hypothetical protein TNIN_402541 [Trichonephila inaurata madagascariensis]